MTREGKAAIQCNKTSFVLDNTLDNPGQSTGQDTNWSKHLLAKPVKKSIQMYFPSVVVTQQLTRSDHMGRQQQAPRISTLTDYKWFLGPLKYPWTHSFKWTSSFLLRLTIMLPQCPLSIQTCGFPVTQPAKVKEAYLRPYHRYKKSCMLTRTRQAHYVQTMRHCLQSCALFHSLHPTPLG